MATLHLPDSDEYPHPIVEGDPFWQESVFIGWRDATRPIGGIFRLGHEPNWQGRGRAPVWFGVHAGDKRFREVVPDGPLDVVADRKGPGLAAGDSYSFFWDGGPRIHGRRPGVELVLEVEDLYPRTDFFAKQGTLSEDFAAGHFEASGRAVGRLTLDGEHHEIDGWCHRDHSWGPRRWETLLTHRWVSGSAGPALSFGSISWHGLDGTLARFGYVVRNGEVSIADTVDFTVHLAEDGLTHTGGEITWRLPGGEDVTLRPRLDTAYLSEHEGHAFVDAICTFEHEGLTGYCDLEVTNNARAGRGPITQCLHAVHQDGLSERTKP
jgi:hypothetical protein